MKSAKAAGPDIGHDSRRDGSKEGFIGHYGCSGRLVKMYADQARTRRGVMRPAQRFRITCPACGRLHRVEPIWRRPRDPHERDLAEVRV